MEIQSIKTAELKPYEKNPRRNDVAVDGVAKSIETFGFKVPIIVDKHNVIIAGHTRYKAALKLGLEEVPCIVADDLTEDQVKAFRIADNKVAEAAEWDIELLNQEMLDLINDGFDMSGYGFTDDELADIFQEEQEAQEDGYEPEPPAQPKSKIGDIYQLGDHRLMCGDSTDELQVARLMDGQQADLVVTDPPYNVNYNGDNDKATIMNDDMSDAAFFSFLKDFYTNMLDVLKPGGAFYIFHADSEGYNFRAALKEAGGVVRETIIWVKNALVLGRQDYQWQHEPCLYGWKEGAAHYFTDDRTNTTVYEDQPDLDSMKKEDMKKLLEEIYSDGLKKTVIHCDKPKANDLHPTMKPVKLCGELISNSSKPGETVLDLFGGSGSTMIAAEQLGRKCIMMEYDPKYVDVIIDRWETFTGNKAIKL